MDLVDEVDIVGVRPKYVCLDVKDVVFRYPTAATDILSGVSFKLFSGEIAALTGPSAAGKSTFGMLLKGFLAPTGGEIALLDANGHRTTAAEERLKLVGWTDGRPERQIFAATVFAEVAFAPRRQGLKEPMLSSRVEWALGQVGLDPIHFKERLPLGLSGGEKRRLGLAGVIAMDCIFYIFDDPTAGLDDDGVESLGRLIQSLAENGCGVLLLGQDIDFFRSITNTLWRLEAGKMVLKAPSAYT